MTYPLKDRTGELWDFANERWLIVKPGACWTSILRCWDHLALCLDTGVVDNIFEPENRPLESGGGPVFVGRAGSD